MCVIIHTHMYMCILMHLCTHRNRLERMQKLGWDCMLSGSIQIAMALAIVASFMTIIVEAQMQSPPGSDAARVFAFLDTVSSLSTLFCYRYSLPYCSTIFSAPKIA